MQSRADRVGKIKVVFRIEPDITKRIVTNIKMSREGIKEFNAGSKGEWAKKILDYIMQEDEDMKQYFTLTFAKSDIGILSSDTSKVIEDNGLAVSTKGALIRNNIDHLFLDVNEFRKLFKMLKGIAFNNSLQAKIKLSFNNRNNVSYIITDNKNEPLLLTKRSLRYMTPNDIKECIELSNYLNTILTTTPTPVPVNNE